VPVFETIVLPPIDGNRLVALESALLERVSAGHSLPTLLLFEITSRGISIGRYHLYDGPSARRGIGVYRRLTGGRVYGAGGGWLGCALILPNAAALLPGKLRPRTADQVMNRYVRGVVEAMKSIGIDAFYPGRDAITANRREIGMCSFETAESGAVLFECFAAIRGGLSALPFDLEKLDPEGSLTAPMYNDENSTTVERQLGRAIERSVLQDAIIRGFESLVGESGHRSIDDSDPGAAETIAEGWLSSRRKDQVLDKHSRVSTQLGFAEVHACIRGNIIERALLSGDIIANSSGIEALERELGGKQPDLLTVSKAVMKIYGNELNYILGLGELTNLTRLITSLP